MLTIDMNKNIPKENRPIVLQNQEGMFNDLLQEVAEITKKQLKRKRK